MPFAELPVGPFSTVVADPPWPFADALPGPKRGAHKHYQLLTLGEIAALPVRDVVTERAHLYLWAPNAFTEEAYAVARAWGFQPKTLLTWVKVARSGRVRIGMGHYFRNATEHVLFATRGNMRTLRRDVPTVFLAERGTHSTKPGEFYELVRRSSPGPRLELFSRQQRDGFTVWGDEV